MSSILYIKPSDDSIKVFYENHSTYHEGDSGLDLFFPKDITINPGEVVKVDLGISCQMIEQSLADVDFLKKYMLYENININNVVGDVLNFKHLVFTKKNVSYYLYPRSSIANTPLILTNNVGIVDSGYTGSLKAALRNVGVESYTIKKGERLLQICTGNLKPFKFTLVDKLSETSRGSSGFGSTG